MPDLKTLPSPILIHVANTLQVPMKGLLATVELLDEGATVPFIARYRKEVTGNLDEVQIRAIEEKLLYFRDLQARKETVLASIQGTRQAYRRTESSASRPRSKRASWKISIFPSSPSGAPRR